MKDLPYFLALIKKNLILWTIITTGSFSKVDFGKAQYDLRTPHFLVLKNYSLSEDDKFKEIWISCYPYHTSIIFKESGPKYYKNLKYYFGSDEVKSSRGGSYTTDSIDYAISKPMLGPIKLSEDTDVRVVLQRSGITVDYYSKEYYMLLKRRVDSLRKADTVKN